MQWYAAFVHLCEPLDGHPVYRILFIDIFRICMFGQPGRPAERYYNDVGSDTWIILDHLGSSWIILDHLGHW